MHKRLWNVALALKLRSTARGNTLSQSKYCTCISPEVIEDGVYWAFPTKNPIITDAENTSLGGLLNQLCKVCNTTVGGLQPHSTLLIDQTLPNCSATRPLTTASFNLFLLWYQTDWFTPTPLAPPNLLHPFYIDFFQLCDFIPIHKEQTDLYR